MITTTLTIHVTKTNDGKFDYVQIMDRAGLSVNIVLIASHIKILDVRKSSIPGIKQ